MVTPVGPVVGDRRERLERQVQHLLGLEFVLELVFCRGVGLLEVAATKPVVEGDIGSLDSLQMLEIRERAGGLQLVVHEGLRGQRVDLVENRGQFFVFRGN